MTGVEEVKDDEIEMLEVSSRELNNHKISIHVIVDMHRWQTMCVKKGFVGKEELQILIDTRSAHNFLNSM